MTHDVRSRVALSYRFLLSAACATLVLLLSLHVTAAAQSSVSCRIQDFEATVHYGPDAGLSLGGVLTLQLDASGDTHGTLVRADGSQVNVVGQVTGRAINLALDLGNGRRVVGVGTADADIRSCQGAIGGQLSGPEPGDLGDWGYAIGG